METRRLSVEEIPTCSARLGDRLVVNDFAFTDPGFFGMFSFDLIAGNPSLALADPHNVVLTAATTEALWIKLNPVGQTLSIRIGERFQDFVVSGTIGNIPGNSSLLFDGILPFSQVLDAYRIDKNNNSLFIRENSGNFGQIRARHASTGPSKKELFRP